jgi:predicted ATP-grasp superfamily ATP-dependent carboligase
MAVSGISRMHRARHRSTGPNRRPAALVFGDMDLVRPLWMAGIRSASVAVPHDPTRFSRCTTTIAHWDPDSTNEELVEPLVRWGKAQAEPPVLYYQWDGHLRFVSRYREQLAEAFRFVVDDEERVEAYLDKDRFGVLAAELGLPVPHSRVVDTLTPEPPHDLELPTIVKPCHRVDDRWFTVRGSAKAFRLDTARELLEVWPRLQAFGRPVVTQEFIPGDETRIESYHVYIDHEGATRGEFTGRKIRTVPAEYGATTALVITATEDVLGLGRQIVAKLGLRGVAKLDFKRGPDGRLHLLEVNPRFNLWHHPGARAGVNLPAIVYRDLTGRPGEEAGAARQGVHWCSPYDLAAVDHDPKSLARWLAFAAGCEAKAVWALDDPLPFVATCAERLLGRHHGSDDHAAQASG